MITEQHQHHWLRDLGLLTQPVREKTEPQRNGNVVTKTKREAYCRLSKDQMQRLIEHVTPQAQSYLIHAEKMYDATPKELLTDDNGNVLKLLTFKKLTEDIRCGRDKKDGQKKYILIRMINAGCSIEQIIEKHPYISKKYAQEIIREIKQARAENDNQ